MAQSTALRSAFLETSYGLCDERFSLSERRGQPPSWTRPGLNWAIVTAWNPAGEQHPDRANHVRQSQLRAAVVERRLAFLEGFNGAGVWQEDALLIQGATLRDAVNWGQVFGQAAVLYGCGARVALVWLSPLRAERFWAATSKAG